MRNILKCAVLLGSIVFSIAAQAQMAVVVGANSPATALTTEQVASIFLGKLDNLPGVGRPKLLDQDESNAIRGQFYTKVTGMSADQVNALRSRLAFSGKGTAPEVLKGANEVKQRVTSDVSAIGYIEKGSVDSTVKVLLLLE